MADPLNQKLITIFIESDRPSKQCGIQFWNFQNWYQKVFNFRSDFREFGEFQILLSRPIIPELSEFYKNITGSNKWSDWFKMNLC